MEKRQVFFCECSEPTHQLIFDVTQWEYKDRQQTELTVFYNLKHIHSFTRRLVNAFNYLFKRDVKRIDYCDIMFSDVKKVESMRDFLNETIEEMKKNS